MNTEKLRKRIEKMRLKAIHDFGQWRKIAELTGKMETIERMLEEIERETIEAEKEYTKRNMTSG